MMKVNPMKFERTFEVNAPLAAVAEFHSKASSMAAITPPPVMVQIHEAPPQLNSGDEMEFTLWTPFPIRWRAAIDDVGPNGFTDRQLSGPFQTWEHRHQFEAVDEHTTQVIDTIQGQLRSHPLWGPVGLGMWLSLPMLFFYRRWQTKRLLEKNQHPVRQ